MTGNFKLATLVALFMFATTLRAQIDDNAMEALLDAGDTDQVTAQMEGLLAKSDDNASAHYWLARASLAELDDASVFRQPFLARSAKSHLEAALAIEPDHIQALEALTHYMIQAPAIAGGSIKSARTYADRVQSLSAARGLWLHAAIAEADEDHATANTLKREALAAQEWQWDRQYQLVVHAVHHQLTNAPAVLEEARKSVVQFSDDKRVHASLLDYQLGKYAATTGNVLALGHAALSRYLQSTPGEDDPGLEWAQFRLAQIERQQGLADQAHRRLAALAKTHIPTDLAYALKDERRWFY